MGISEWRKKTGELCPSKINIDSYTYEYTTTKSSKEGTLVYIDKLAKYKLRKDFHLINPKKLSQQICRSNRH